jgi:hypothetical protein
MSPFTKGVKAAAAQQSARGRGCSVQCPIEGV